MAWTWKTTPVLDTVVTVAFGTEIQNAIKQIAADVYITPANGGDGVADLPYPLERLAPVFSSHAVGNGTTGVTVNLPAGFTPATADDYEVNGLSYQEDPGGNGQIWAEKGTSSFVIKHYGSATGKKIGYTIFRKTA